MSKLLTGIMYKCGKCNEEIYFDDKYKSKRGVNIPMDPDTGKYHKCKSSVHKRKGMLRILNKTQIKYYKALELYPGATVAEIEAKFKELVEYWHPDNEHKRGSFFFPDRAGDYNKYQAIIEAHNNIRLIYVSDE
jgi:hypothetical protein